jgi:hypothetical protein
MVLILLMMLLVAGCGPTLTGGIREELRLQLSNFNASSFNINCNVTDSADVADAADAAEGCGGGMWIHPHWRGQRGTLPSFAAVGVFMTFVTITAIVGNFLVIICFIR